MQGRSDPQVQILGQRHVAEQSDTEPWVEVGTFGIPVLAGVFENHVVHVDTHDESIVEPSLVNVWDILQNILLRHSRQDCQQNKNSQ